MAGQKEISVGSKFTGDAKGFEKAASTVGKSAKQVRKELTDTSDLVSEVGGAISGVAGDIGGSISQLMTAATPIGAVVILIGAIAKAWKTATENIDLYLKSADKLKAGPAAFQTDVEQARTDTRKRARGMITEGLKQEQEAYNKLARFSAILTEEEKKFYGSLMKSGQEMQKEGKILLDSVRGIKDKASWQMQYNKLLQEQERLNDEELANKTKWEELDAQLIEQRRIIGDSDAKSTDKKKAGVEAERLANQLLQEKVAFTDRQLANVKSLSDLTATQEVVEGRVAELERLKYTYQREYGLDMIKVQKMQDRAEKSLKSQADSEEKKLRALKEQNILNSEAISLEKATIGSIRGGIKAHFKPSISGITKPELAGLQDYNGSPAKLKEIGDYLDTDTAKAYLFTDSLMAIGEAIGGIASDSKGAMKGLVSAVLGAVKQIINAFLAEAIAGVIAKETSSKGIAGIITAAIGVAALEGLWASKIPSFATGTSYAPGGLSLVGERGPELVNLPQGSKVFPSGQGAMRIEVVGRISGRDLMLVQRRNGF